MVTASSPIALKRHVALQLRSLREAAGIKRDHVAEYLGCTVGHIRHLETLISLPKPMEVRVLLPMYGVPERIESFLALVDAAKRGRDWWADFPGVPSWLELLLGIQAAAATIDRYDAMVVPGLFQTPAYAEAVIRGGEPGLSDDEVKQRVELRMARQDVLTRPDPPRVQCVLDEAVLYRQAKDPSVLPEQLEHLVKLTELPNVHIQVLARSALGLHCAIDGTFSVITFGPELVNDPGVAYTESRISGTYYEQPEEIARYRDTWSAVQTLAETPERSRNILAQRAKEIAK